MPRPVQTPSPLLVIIIIIMIIIIIISRSSHPIESQRASPQSEKMQLKWKKICVSCDIKENIEIVFSLLAPNKGYKRPLFSAFK